MLSVAGLRRAYGDVVALDDVSFSVPAGSITGFVGANGAGKTTTMRILVGVLEPDAGEVRWNGRPVDAALRSRIGYMPEERGLYPKMAVGEQLTYLAELHGVPRREAGERARTWFERLGVKAELTDRVEELSLGNQQRVQLAAALVHDPALLVLDEPFSGLDPIGTDALAEVLTEQAAAGLPVLFSSHQLDLVERLCERVVIVRDGRLVADGTVEELAASGPRRVVIDMAGAANGWAQRLPGVTSTRAVPDGVEITLGDGADPADLLLAAQRVGVVRRFDPRRRTLAETYRQVVTS